jgi:small multidrug resistance pump
MDAILFFLFGAILLATVAGAVVSVPVGILYIAAVGIRRLWRAAHASRPLAGCVRIGDAERSVVFRHLGEHFALGRLSLAELEERSAAVWESRTAWELAEIESDLPDLAPPLARFRPWLYAAAAYNLAWGSVVVVAPGLFAGLLGHAAASAVLWQVVGMLVLVYAPGYWWAARRPDRHPHLVALGMLGKLLGPLGFLGAAATGALPVAFGLVILTNDVIWWPAFALYLSAAARLRGGWAALLAG